jgi:hypothetical protein
MALSKIDVANMLTGLVPNDNTIRRPNAKPLIINGDMQVAQRGTSFTHANSNNNEFPVDRFQFVLGSIGEYTSIQESLSSGAAYNAGFKKAARIDTTSAVSSPDAGDYFWFQYIMEAQDCLVFKKGTSSAEKMTVAFWVKSNKTGTGQLTVKDSDNDRQVAGTYAISSADTWEHKVINLPADTSGAMNNDNGAGFRFEWWLGAGSSYSGGAVPTAWEARADGDRGVSTLAINDNTANDWAITGIQVEVGEFSSTTLPPFQFEDTGDNLLRCKRYYQTTVMPDTSDYWGQGYYYTNSEFTCKMPIQEMRAQPTLDQVSGSNYFTVYSNNAGDAINDFALDGSSSRRCVSFTDTGESSGTAGFGGGLYKTNASARFAFDAEL